MLFMEKVKNSKVISFLWNNKNVIFVFIFTLLIYMFLGFYINNGDPTASYGFSHAIVNGEVPYRDFNTISTPLYAFYCSIFLLIYDDFLMFLIAQSILVTIMFYFLFKTYGNKAWIVLLAMVILKFMGFNATYNFCCLAMFSIIIYLEREHNDRDYLIGLFLGLAFLSKQTIGGLLVLPTILYYFKTPKKILKRFIGWLFPCLILIIYLIFNNALFDFINLCFLGLLDFGGNNKCLFTIWFFISLFMILIAIFFIFKKKDIMSLYMLVPIGFVIPIFDLPHFAYYLVAFMIVIVSYIKELNKPKLFLVLGCILEFTIFNWQMAIHGYKASFYKGINHFKYKYNYELDYNSDMRQRKFINEYIDLDPILIMYYSMHYNISTDRDITYFDIFLYGNHGYDGTNMMINRIKKMKDQYFIVNMSEYEDSKNSNGTSQFNYEIVDYIINNSTIYAKKGDFVVYYKE